MMTTISSKTFQFFLDFIFLHNKLHKTVYCSTKEKEKVCQMLWLVPAIQHLGGYGRKTANSRSVWVTVSSLDYGGRLGFNKWIRWYILAQDWGFWSKINWVCREGVVHHKPMVGEVTFIMAARKQKGEQGPSPGLTLMSWPSPKT